MSQHLSAGQKAQLEATLRERLAGLRRQLDEHQQGQSRVEHARDVLLQDGDDATQRDADREVDFALSDLDTTEIAAVQQALQRLANGTYGLCADCGTEVPFARLSLEPQAMRCVSCEAARERGAPPRASL